MGIYFEDRKLKIAKHSKLNNTIQRFKTLSHISNEMLTSVTSKVKRFLNICYLCLFNKFNCSKSFQLLEKPAC